MADVFDNVTKRVLTSKSGTKFADNIRYGVNPDLPDGVPLKYVKITGLGSRPLKNTTITTGLVAEMDQAEKDVVDSGELLAAKDAKNGQIDTRTVQIIGGGFDYDSRHFSLSTPAQLNWTGLLALDNAGLMVYPTTISTDDTGIEYEIANQNAFRTWSGAVFTAVKVPYDGGRALKLLVEACSTIAEVEAIVDPR